MVIPSNFSEKPAMTISAFNFFFLSRLLTSMITGSNLTRTSSLSRSRGMPRLVQAIDPVVERLYLEALSIMKFWGTIKVIIINQRKITMQQRKLTVQTNTFKIRISFGGLRKSIVRPFKEKTTSSPNLTVQINTFKIRIIFVDLEIYCWKISRNTTSSTKLRVQINTFEISIVFRDLDTFWKSSRWILGRKNTSSLKLDINWLFAQL